MKKENFIILAFLIGIFFFLSASIIWSQTKSDTAPIFDKNPSIIIDLWKNGGKGKYKDYVRLTNATLHQNISFYVFGYEQKNDKWTQIGSVQLKDHCDISTINSPLRGRMNEFRWLAIYSLDGIEFDAQAMVSRNDIYVTIFKNEPTGVEISQLQSNDNAPAFDIQFSIVLDLWRNKGKYSDYIKLTNASLNQKASFNIYGYDQKNNQWIIIGPAQLKRIGDTDTVDSPWRGRMKEFRWLAIHSLDGITFNTQTMVSSNDIMIMIVDK